MAVVVGWAEKIRPVGKLRSVLGGVDTGQRQQGHNAQIKRGREAPLLLSRLHKTLPMVAKKIPIRHAPTVIVITVKYIKNTN